MGATDTAAFWIGKDIWLPDTRRRGWYTGREYGSKGGRESIIKPADFDDAGVLYRPKVALTRYFQAWRVYNWARLLRALGIHEPTQSLSGYFGGKLRETRGLSKKGKAWALVNLNVWLERLGRYAPQPMPPEGVERMKQVAHERAAQRS